MKLDHRHQWLATLLVLSSFGVSSSQESRVSQHESETWDYSPFPAPDNGYVTDLADLLTDEEEERIEVWLWQTESRTGIEIMALFQRLSDRGITIVVVTHDPEVARFARRILRFRDGRLVADDRTDTPARAAEALAELDAVAS